MKPLTKKQLKGLAYCIQEAHTVYIGCYVVSRKGRIEYGLAKCASCGKVARR